MRLTIRLQSLATLLLSTASMGVAGIVTTLKLFSHLPMLSALPGRPRQRPGAKKLDKAQ